MDFFKGGGTSGALDSAVVAVAGTERRGSSRPWATNANVQHASGDGGRSSLDFAAARTKHLSWKTRLRGFLDGKESMTEAQAVSHRDCDLGKWLYSKGMAEYGDIAAMKRLEKDHTAMHALVKDVVKLKNAGESERAEAKFREVEPLSAKVVSSLNEVEQHVRGGNAQAAATTAAAPRRANSGRGHDHEWEEF
jgi:methyl-accepting chemotaxis protein